MSAWQFGILLALVGMLWIGGQLQAAAHGKDPYLTDWLVAHGVVVIGIVTALVTGLR